jgi:hypothetical protein
VLPDIAAPDSSALNIAVELARNLKRHIGRVTSSSSALNLGMTKPDCSAASALGYRRLREMFPVSIYEMARSFAATLQVDRLDVDSG